MKLMSEMLTCREGADGLLSPSSPDADLGLTQSCVCLPVRLPRPMPRLRHRPPHCPAVTTFPAGMLGVHEATEGGELWLRA
jgi:hypothetical protein